MQQSVFYFRDEESQALALANALGCSSAQIDLHRFPDGESLLTLSTAIPQHLLMYRGLDHPNEKIVELILCCASARKKGVQRISLITPYLCYMRQDRENHPGEVVSQSIIGELLSEYIDDIITVDPHLHRIHDLHQAYPLQHALSLSAAELIGAYLKKNFPKCLLIGPDEESEQWVSVAANIAGLDYCVASKIRMGDRKVEIELPSEDYAGRNIVLVDDMISSGGTIINIARQLTARKAQIKACIVTHCLCSPDDEKNIVAAGVPTVISCDSISHHTNHIALTDLLAEAIRKIN
ncbi:MAG: ribose-phosphate diphosphokinase [Gammaproteobacteria bacterium]|nr:ribose-phosphate diphosphokinase [Gammaproteobacteria bacterium]